MLIVNVNPDEVPPPGVGLNTVTDAVPGVAIYAAGTAAWSEVTETYVVVRFVPFQLTTEKGLKLVPVTERVKVDPPANALLGLKEAATGTGLL